MAFATLSQPNAKPERLAASLFWTWTHLLQVDVSNQSIFPNEDTDERTCGDCVVNFTNAKTPQVSPQVVVLENTTTCGGFVQFVVFSNIKSYRFVVFSNKRFVQLVVFSWARFVVIFN